jgi:VanZ family protein
MRDNIFLAMPFIIMAVLYWSSSMSYESQSTLPQLRVILGNEPFRDFLSRYSLNYGESIISVDQVGYYSFIEFFIRKGAHFISYFALGFFWYLGLRKRVNENWLTILLAILLCVGYAAFDEFRQSFHPNRTGMMEDVILDTAGALAGILMAWVLSVRNIIR